MISITALTGLNSAVPWGLWVSIYIFLVGISAGAFALVSWGNLQGNLHFKKITRLGLVLSVSTLLAGLLSIQVDLGHIERFYKLFTSPNFTSVMALMVWLYGAYLGILAISLLWLKKGIPRPFLAFSFVFALAVIVLESLLFARPPGKHWHSLIFPLHFLSSSLASAIAAILCAGGIFWPKEKKTELLRGLGKIAVALVVINMIVEVIDIVAIGGFVHPLSWVLLLGSVIAILLLRKPSVGSITAGGFVELVVVLLAKYNSLISVQIAEPFKGFAKAYIEPRLLFRYAPNGFEIIVAVFLIGLAAGLFYFLYRILPLTREE